MSQHTPAPWELTEYALPPHPSESGNTLKPITLEWLKRVRACTEQVELFFSTFGESCDVTAENIRKAASVSLDLNWVASKLLKESVLEAYQEAIAPHERAYQEAIAPHERAYREATAQHYRAYREAIAPHERAYQEAIAPHYRAYQEAIAPHYRAYQEAIAEILIALLGLESPVEAATCPE